MLGMRSLAVYLTLLVLIAISIGIGFIASDWPSYCRKLNWCDPTWPAGH